MATWVTVTMAVIQIIQGIITGGDKIRLKRKKNRAKIEMKKERVRDEKKEQKNKESNAPS